MEEVYPYIPPGWLRYEEKGRIVYRTDIATGRIAIRSRAELQELIVHDHRFAGGEFRADRLCFSKKQEKMKTVNESKEQKAESVISDKSIEEVTTGAPDIQTIKTSIGDREEENLTKATELLYVAIGEEPDHVKCLEEAAREMHRILKDGSDTTVEFDIDRLKQSINRAQSVDEVCEALWEEPEIQRYFAVMENARVLSNVLELANQQDNPLNNPVPDRKRSTYSDLFFYGQKHCPSLIRFLVNLVMADKGPVETSDVVTVSFYFAVMAHLASRVNNTVARTKTLLLRKQGLTEPGLEHLSKLGITETDRNLRKFRYLLADLGETHFAAQLRAGLAYSTTTDNLDKKNHHLTQAYVELERRNTSEFSTAKPPISEIKNLFSIGSISLFSEQNKHLNEHMLHVAGISVGRRLVAETPSAKSLGKYLPAHHRHNRSHFPKAAAILVIKNPEYLQETKNAEFVEYLKREQWDFLTSVAESLDEKEKPRYLEDLALMKQSSDMEEVETEEMILAREQAENRVCANVEAFGEWIGHGDALTFKMFWMGAKALCQGAVTALERLDFLNLFRLGFLHLKFNKVYMEYAKLMPSKTNLDEEGTLSQLKALLPGMDKISNNDKDISKAFEFHDQFFAAVMQAKTADAWNHYLSVVPDALKNVKCEDSAVAAVLAFLRFYDIEFMFDPEKEPLDITKYDDLQQYDREGIAYWVLSILLDDGEAEEDSELLEALELTIMLEFLNKNKSGAQTSKYSYLLLLDYVTKKTASERSQQRMDDHCCVNPYGQKGGGLFRDKVNEHIVRMVKEILDSLGISTAKDLDIQKMVASVTPATLVTEHDLKSSGFSSKYKQHSADLIGKDRTEMIRQHVNEVAAFSSTRQKVDNFLNKYRGSPFQGLSKEAINRFLTRNLNNYYRNFPDKKSK